jgi:hypothetical protein
MTLRKRRNWTNQSLESGILSLYASRYTVSPKGLLLTTENKILKFKLQYYTVYRYCMPFCTCTVLHFRLQNTLLPSLGLLAAMVVTELSTQAANSPALEWEIQATNH